MNADMKDKATITGWGVLLGVMFAFGFGIGGFFFGGDDGVELPPSAEERCGEAADEVCPSGHWGDWSSTQVEACRSREFKRCLDAAREPTMEQCREECAEIVKDLALLRQANDDLWERWLACSEEE